MTATELHVRTLVRLFYAVSYALAERALVLMDIFLRFEGREQVSPDLIVAPPAPREARRVYAVPDEQVPLVTVEVLSEVNWEPEGRKKLEEKRELLGRIGVPVHIEVDPDYGVVTRWANKQGRFERVAVGTSYDGADLGGVRVETPAPGEVHIYLPNGREALGPDAEAARADAQAARADAEAARADAEAARAQRLAERLRQAGIDPDGL